MVEAGTAFAHGDCLCFWGQTSIPGVSGALSFAGGVNMEILRCSAGTSTPFVPDSATKYAHNDNEYFTLANAWELWLPGGSTYALIFDAGGVTTASAVFRRDGRSRALRQTDEGDLMLPAHSLIGPPGGWGLQKPPCGVPIDRSHPLAQGLVGKSAVGGGRRKVSVRRIRQRENGLFERLRVGTVKPGKVAGFQRQQRLRKPRHARQLRVEVRGRSDGGDMGLDDIDGA